MYFECTTFCIFNCFLYLKKIVNCKKKILQLIWWRSMNNNVMHIDKWSRYLCLWLVVLQALINFELFLSCNRLFKNKKRKYLLSKVSYWFSVLTAAHAQHCSTLLWTKYTEHGIRLGRERLNLCSIVLHYNALHFAKL